MKHDAPPCAVESEQALLGALMLASLQGRGSEIFDEVSDLITGASFYQKRHQTLFDTIARFVEENRSFDPVTLSDWVAVHAQDIEAGYPIELANSMHSFRMVRAYAEEVAEKATYRRVIEIGTDLVNRGFAQEDSPEDLLGFVQSASRDILAAQPSEIISADAAMQAAFEDMLESQDRGPSGMDGLPTGIQDWDDLLGGLVPGLHILAARPKMGKSTLAQNIAEHLAVITKRAVMIATLEMSAKQFAKRMISSIGDVDSQRVRSGRLEDDEWARVSDARRSIRGARIYFASQGRRRCSQICAQARKLHAEVGLSAVILDYLQIMDLTPAYKGETTSQILGRATAELSDLGHKLGIPVIALSQLNRGVEERTNKRPTPSDLRDSGALEQDAETVTFVYRDEIYHPDSPWKGTAELILALNRHGPPGECRVLARLDRYRFEALPFGWEAPRREKKQRKGAFGMREDREAAR